jgi:hypothetical protein
MPFPGDGSREGPRNAEILLRIDAADRPRFYRSTKDVFEDLLGVH